MTSEVKYANYLVDGTVADSINFDDFVCLYSSSPCLCISKSNTGRVCDDLRALCSRLGDERGSGEDVPKLLNDLSELMKQGAEALTDDEFRSCSKPTGRAGGG